MHRYIIGFLLALHINLKSKFINLLIKMFWFLPNNKLMFFKKLKLLLKKKTKPKPFISSLLAC